MDVTRIYQPGFAIEAIEDPKEIDRPATTRTKANAANAPSRRLKEPNQPLKIWAPFHCRQPIAFDQCRSRNHKSLHPSLCRRTPKLYDIGDIGRQTGQQSSTIRQVPPRVNSTTDAAMITTSAGAIAASADRIMAEARTGEP